MNIQTETVVQNVLRGSSCIYSNYCHLLVGPMNAPPTVKKPDEQNYDCVYGSGISNFKSHICIKCIF